MSAHRSPPTEAPDSRETAFSSFDPSELSGKIAFTFSSRIWSTSRLMSFDEGCAWLERDGISAPTTSSPYRSA